jgi:hypothetical protein
MHAQVFTNMIPVKHTRFAGNRVKIWLRPASFGKETAFIHVIQYLTEMYDTFTCLQPACYPEICHVMSYWKKEGERCGMEEVGWRMHWSMALRPDASMLPGGSVFLQAPGGVSLTATVGDIPELLPGMWEGFSFMSGGEVEEGCYYKRQTRAREDTLSRARASGG